MTTRTTTHIMTFRQAFVLAGIDGPLPPGDYRVDTDEELIDGLSFLAWKRVATIVHLPAQSHPALRRERIVIDPEDLQRAQDRDASPRCR
jgi:hypothetical protein